MHFERDFNFTAINETKTYGVCPKEEVAIEINAMKTKQWGGGDPPSAPSSRTSCEDRKVLPLAPAVWWLLATCASGAPKMGLGCIFYVNASGGCVIAFVQPAFLI